jgi:hypothetical protein
VVAGVSFRIVGVIADRAVEFGDIPHVGYFQWFTAIDTRMCPTREEDGGAGAHVFIGEPDAYNALSAHLCAFESSFVDVMSAEESRERAFCCPGW